MINNTINETVTVAVACVGNCTWEALPENYKWLLVLAGIILYLFMGWLTLKLATYVFDGLDEVDDPPAFVFILLWPVMLLLMLLFFMLQVIKIINYLFQLEEEIDELKTKIDELTSKIKKERRKERRLKTTKRTLRR